MIMNFPLCTAAQMGHLQILTQGHWIAGLCRITCKCALGVSMPISTAFLENPFETKSHFCANSCIKARYSESNEAKYAVEYDRLRQVKWRLVKRQHFRTVSKKADQCHKPPGLASVPEAQKERRKTCCLAFWITGTENSNLLFFGITQLVERTSLLCALFSVWQCLWATTKEGCAYYRPDRALRGRQCSREQSIGGQLWSPTKEVHIRQCNGVHGTTKRMTWTQTWRLKDALLSVTHPFLFFKFFQPVCKLQQHRRQRTNVWRNKPRRTNPCSTSKMVMKSFKVAAILTPPTILRSYSFFTRTSMSVCLFFFLASSRLNAYFGNNTRFGLHCFTLEEKQQKGEPKTKQTKRNPWKCIFNWFRPTKLNQKSALSKRKKTQLRRDLLETCWVEMSSLQIECIYLGRGVKMTRYFAQYMQGRLHQIWRACYLIDSVFLSGYQARSNIIHEQVTCGNEYHLLAVTARDLARGF